jgi:hypothetical protein
MFLIQALIHFYNRHLNLDPLKKITLFMAYSKKVAFYIDGIIIHSDLFIPINCKDLPSLSLK